MLRFFALAADPAKSSIGPDLLGVSALPVAEEDLQSYACDGGWNLFIDSNTRDAAYEFIRFLSAPERWKFRSTEGSVLPTRRKLYENEELLREVPIAELG